MSGSVNGAQCTTVGLSMPRVGPWQADVEMATDGALSGRVTLTLADLTLVGTVRRSATHAGVTRARIVAGADGWGSEAPERGYQSPSGLALAQIVGDAARTVGETVGAISGTLGGWYGRQRGPASQVFALIRSGYWWVDDSGVTQIGERPGGLVTAPWDLISSDGAAGSLILGAEELTTFRPGRSLEHPALDGQRVIDFVRWVSAGDELRGEVWYV